MPRLTKQCRFCSRTLYRDSTRPIGEYLAFLWRHSTPEEARWCLNIAHTMRTAEKFVDNSHATTSQSEPETGTDTERIS